MMCSGFDLIWFDLEFEAELIAISFGCVRGGGIRHV
jgi:hypothetical protein